MRRFFAFLVLALATASALALTPGQSLLLFGGSSHYLGASADYNFASGQLFGPPLSDTRAGSESEICNGTLYTFPANVAPITPGCGVWAWEARTNLFLNNQAPVTQTITVASGSVYTISFYGTGVLTLSGACTNVETGSPYPTKTQFSCVAATTSLVTTVTTLGTMNYVQVELNPNATTAPQGFATGPILTSGAAVTRNANNTTATVPYNGNFSLSVKATLEGTPDNYNRIVSINNGSGSQEAEILESAGYNNVYYAQSLPAAITLGYSPATGVLFNVAASSKSGSQLFSANGNTVTGVAVAGTNPNALTTFQIGSDYGGSISCNCLIARASYAPLAWPQTTLNSITSH